MIEPVCPVSLKGGGSIIEEYVPLAQFNASVGLEEKAKFTGFNVCIVYGYVCRAQGDAVCCATIQVRL
jgi:hypothetical protein